MQRDGCTTRSLGLGTYWDCRGRPVAGATGVVAAASRQHASYLRYYEITMPSVGRHLDDSNHIRDEGGDDSKEDGDMAEALNRK